MKKALMVVVALVVLLAMPLSICYAYKGDGKKSKAHSMDMHEKAEKKAHMLLENKDELGLSDQQVKKIKELKIKTKKSLIRQQADIEIAALEIMAKMWEETIDLKAMNALTDKKYDLKKAKAKSGLAAYVELKSILTEKQKEKLKEIYEAKKKEMQSCKMSGTKKCPMMDKGSKKR